MSMTSDNSNVDTDQDFSSSGGDRVSTVQVPMIEPADVVSLPKGQAFALLEGGQLWKIRMPLPLPDTGTEIPTGITDLASRMREKYHTGDHWWETVMPAPIHVEPATGGPGATAPLTTTAAPSALEKTNWEGDFEVASGYSNDLNDVDDGVDED